MRPSAPKSSERLVGLALGADDYWKAVPPTASYGPAARRCCGEGQRRPAAESRRWLRADRVPTRVLLSHPRRRAPITVKPPKAIPVLDSLMKHQGAVCCSRDVLMPDVWEATATPGGPRTVDRTATYVRRRREIRSSRRHVHGVKAVRLTTGRSSDVADVPLSMRAPFRTKLFFPRSPRAEVIALAVAGVVCHRDAPADG